MKIKIYFNKQIPIENTLYIPENHPFSTYLAFSEHQANKPTQHLRKEIKNYIKVPTTR